jgi:hypothetical protein
MDLLQKMYGKIAFLIKGYEAFIGLFGQWLRAAGEARQAWVFFDRAAVYFASDLDLGLARLQHYWAAAEHFRSHE